MTGQRRPYLLTRPEQGWSSLLLLLGMLVLLGVSVADSRPLLLEDYGSLSASLPAMMVAAGLVGYLLARSALGVVRAHLVGALLAATRLLFVAGGALTGRSPLPLELAGISDRITAVWTRLDGDIALLMAEQIQTSTITVYLVLGALCWTTAQFGAFSVFRYDRGGPAVMAVGTILFLNVGLGSLQAQEDLLPVVPVLAVFAALALLLLMRLQLVQQRFAWARRHISDTRDVSRLFIRTGVGFVLIAVISASSLTVWATVEAQDLNVDALEEPLEEVVERLNDLLGFFDVPTGEDIPQKLDKTTKLTTSWDPGEGTAFTAEVANGELYDNYWWGKADDFYDYENDRWRTDAEEGVSDVPAGAPLTPAADAETGGVLQVRAVISVEGGSARRNLFRPPHLLEVSNRDVRARRTEGGGYSDLEFVDPLDPDEDVSIISYVRDYRPFSGDLTGSDLRATADYDYPQWVLDYYLAGKDDPDIIGPNSLDFIRQIRRMGDTPYDWAVAMQSELRKMGYETDLGNACDDYEAFTECLLAIEKGFCQQYATTMVMILRAMDVPARFVTGYLTGVPDGGRWVVDQQALHNWVEVYFPEVGWVRFDPTPGLDDLGQVPTELDEGEMETPGPSEPPELETPEPPFETEEPLDTFEPEGGATGVDGTGGDPTAIFIGLAGIAGLLVAVVSVLLLYRLRRLPEGDDGLAYRGIVSLATRLGYGPHPSQTEYEYAGTLSEAIPTVRDDLYVVTDAQVQTTYGVRELDERRRGPLRAAYARIRTALLRLSLRWRR